jgi:hypothetical protein
MTESRLKLPGGMKDQSRRTIATYSDCRDAPQFMGRCDKPRSNPQIEARQPSLIQQLEIYPC